MLIKYLESQSNFPVTNFPTYLRIKVIPKSNENKITEIMTDKTQGDTIKIKIKAPPIKGKANKELLNFLKNTLNISSSQLSIISGINERIKLIKITAPK